MNTSNANTNRATVTDPVCGMTIDPANAAGSSTYNGETYHFCSRGCEAKFDAAPTAYAEGDGGSCCSPGRSCH